MTARGLAKLIEECGELQQVAGKRLAYYHTEDHPDGGRPIRERLEDEIADVMAACRLVTDLHGLDGPKIAQRSATKLAQFTLWHAQIDNNADGIDHLDDAGEADDVNAKRFSDWLTAYGILHKEAADALEITRGAVTKIINGKTVPGLRLAKRIEQWTNGYVKIKDWVDENWEPHRWTVG